MSLRLHVSVEVDDSDDTISGPMIQAGQASTVLAQDENATNLLDLARAKLRTMTAEVEAEVQDQLRQVVEFLSKQEEEG